MKSKKVCTKCGIEKDISEYGKLKDKNGKYYPKHYCYACERKYMNEWVARNYKPHPKKKYVLPDKKVCIICGVEKTIEYFGLITDKRNGVKRAGSYCKQCAIKKAIENYNNKKNDFEFKLNNRKRAREYEEKNKKIVLEKRHKYHISEKYRENKKRNYYKNHDKIKKQARKNAKRYNSKLIAKIKDTYVVRQLNKSNEFKAMPRSEISDDIIEKKRVQILISRIKRAIKKAESKH